MYYVYVLKSLVERKFYTGHTDSLSRRLREHNMGENYYTRRYLPWAFVYKEGVASLEQAVNREKYFKSHAGRRWLKKNVGL